MTTKQTRQTKQSAKTPKAPPELPEAFYRIDALLRTMRCIAQHEDRLCTLLHSVQQARAVAPDVLDELHTLLAELPSHEYADDLAAVQDALTKPAARPKAKSTKKTSRKSPKKATHRRTAKT